MKKTLIWVLVILFVIIGGFYLYNKLSDTNNYSSKDLYKNSVSDDFNIEEDNLSNTSTDKNINNTTNNTNNSNTSNNTNNTTLNPYTVNNVAKHNSVNSCWSIISNKVYDLTTYINKHPGGKEQILAICGKDGSSLFEGQHGGNMKIENMLSSFYKGDLSN